jgi:hypothetical protein
MQFSNTSNKSKGILQDIDFLCGSTSATYPVVDKVRNVNIALHDVTQLIWQSQDGWFFDDENQTDYPRIRVNLTKGTQDYRVKALSTVLRQIKRIEVKDSGGDFQLLTPLNMAKDIDVAKDDYYSSDGMPLYYDLDGGYITLYPAPTSGAGGCTLASGMAIYFGRDAVEFTSASTTASPGFATQFHRILSYSAAIDFIKQDNNLIQKYMMERNRLMDGLKKYYGSRNLELKPKISPFGKRRWRQYE